MLIATCRTRTLLFELNIKQDDVPKDSMDFLHFINIDDKSCNNAIVWWAKIGRKCFLLLTLVDVTC